jgi:hypothetical protein
MPNMLKSLRQKRHDVFIIERIEHRTALFAGNDKAQLPHKAQMTRDAAFADADLIGNGANTRLALHEREQDSDPVWIAHRPKQLGKSLGGGRIEFKSVVMLYSENASSASRSGHDE